MPETYDEAVNLDLSEAKQVDERLWELPPWHTYWGRFVYPLFVANQQGYLFPLGTAFRFSEWNHIFTARHNFEEALRKHHPNAEEFVRKGLAAARSGKALEHTSLAILSQGPNPKLQDASWDLCTLTSLHMAPPTDLLIGNFLADPSSAVVPTISPTITFAPPRIGEIVHCIGYSEMKVPDGGLSIEDLSSRRLNPYEAYSHRLLVAAGRVNHIFVERLAKGFVEGPCFTIDINLPHGLSGGPILRSDGAVCGAVYSGASEFFNLPTSIGALFYPIFLLGLTFGVSMANGRIQMRATERPVADLVATRAIRTDGAEETQLHFTREGSETRIGAAFHVEDAAYIFKDFGAFQANEPMPPISVEGCLGFKPNLVNPLVRRRREPS